ARSITGDPLTEMAVMSGAFGSSENSAVQGRFASSAQRMLAEVVVEITVMGPGRTAEVSSGIAAAARLAASGKRDTNFQPGVEMNLDAARTSACATRTSAVLGMLV